MANSYRGRKTCQVEKVATPMEVDALQYWCYECSCRVNLREINTIECPICQSGFVEEMPSADTPRNVSPLDFELGEPESDRAFALWAPILLGMMSNRRRRRRLRNLEFEEDENENGNENSNDGDSELDHELESIMRRRRRSAATILQLLQGIRAGITESGNSETEPQNRDRDIESDREGVVLINPFNQTIVVQGSYDLNDDSLNRVPVGSLGDYFVGPGLDVLLQHLSENDPNRYGTPPAQKEAVEALPTVKVKDTVQCSVCLDDCEIGTEVKEMPCKHIFHDMCIFPWLELHSSCPVCRHQLPYDESKLDLEGLRSNNNDNSDSNNSGDNMDDVSDNRRQFSVPLPWPLSSLFSSSSSRSGGGNSSTADAAPHDDAN